MTIRSKQRSSAEILAMPASAKSTQMASPRGFQGSSPVSADLLSIRQHLTYKASIGINDFSFLQQAYSIQVADQLMAKIRTLLDQEFGGLRVHRRHQVFVVNHHCEESLIAGVLRVQFHSRQLPLPATRLGQGLSDLCGVPLAWGVGRTLEAAELQRQSKRRV